AGAHENVRLFASPGVHLPFRCTSGGGRVGVPGDSGRHSNVRLRMQALACVSLLASALLLVLVVACAFRNAAELALGVVGVFVGVLGGWWAITRRGARRVLGLAGAAAGAALFVISVLRAGGEDLASVVRMVIALALLAVAIFAARAAVALRLATSSVAWARVAKPRHPVLLCNPWSGGGKVRRFDIDSL